VEHSFEIAPLSIASLSIQDVKVAVVFLDRARHQAMDADGYAAL
jgi:hypothetical protein